MIPSYGLEQSRDWKRTIPTDMLAVKTNKMVLTATSVFFFLFLEGVDKLNQNKNKLGFIQR